MQRVDSVSLRTVTRNSGKRQHSSKTGKHVPHRFSPETSSKDTSQIFLKEAPTSTCVKMNTDNDLTFAHLMPLCSAARETSDDTKDLVTLLLNSAPEFYED